MLGWRTLAATLLVFAAWRWREEPEGLLPGTAAAALAPLPRGARSPEEFFRDHVQKGVPLLLPLEGNFDALDQLLTGPCADEPLDLLSTQQADVLRDLLDEDLPRWKWFVANLILVLTTGTTVQGWAALRRATPRQLSQGPAAASSYGAPWAAWLMDLVAKAFGSELLRHVAVIAKLIAQPVYLADKVVKEICPSLMDHAALTEHEEYVLRRLGNRQAPWQNLSVIADIGLRHESETRLFYGGPKSYSYPLHRDLPDGDVLCVLHSGCKDVVMLKPESRKHLARLKVPGFEGISQFTWAYDFFTDSNVSGVKGWAGTLRKGELLYMPGEMLHHIRNSCRQSLAICRRPWRASVARDVALETLKSLRLAHEDEHSVEEAVAALKARRRR